MLNQQESREETSEMREAVKKMKDPGWMDKAIDKLNNYLASIKDPRKIVGARIPQGANVPTFTFQIVKRMSITTALSPTTNTDCFGICMGSWCDNSDTPSNYASFIPQPSTAMANPADHFLVGMIGRGGVTAGKPWTMGFPPYPDSIHYDSWDTGNDAVSPLTNNVRLVSAELDLECLGPYLTTQGMFFGTLVPPGVLYEDTGCDYKQITVDQILAYPGSNVFPVARTGAAKVIYRPMQVSDRDFRTIDNLDPESDDYPNEHPTILLGCSGLPSGASLPFIATFTGNFEAIPQTNAIDFVTTLESFNDPLQIAETDNALQTENFFVSGTSQVGKVDYAPSVIRTATVPGVVETKVPIPRPLVPFTCPAGFQEQVDALSKTQPCLADYALKRLVEMHARGELPVEATDSGGFARFAAKFAKPHVVRVPYIGHYAAGDKVRQGVTFTKRGRVRAGKIVEDTQEPKSLFRTVIEGLVSAAPAIGTVLAKAL